MQHAQRMLRLRHVDAADGPPRPADHIQRAALDLRQPVHAFQRRIDPLAAAPTAVLRPQPQRPQRQRGAGAKSAGADLHQLQAAAAQVTHQAVGLRAGRQHPQCRQPALLAAVDQLRPDPRGLGDLVKERIAVAGIPHGRGRDGQDVVDLHLPHQAREPIQRMQSPFLARRIQVAGDLEATPQTAQDLFVEYGQRRPYQACVDHQTHRVGTDVDDGRQPVIASPPGGRLCPLGRPGRLRHQRSVTSSGDTAEVSIALPRPERLGLVMK